MGVLLLLPCLCVVGKCVTPEDLDKPAPAGWSQTPNSSIRDILRAHACDEAWVPGVLAGGSIADGDELRDRDLLGDGPIAAYDALNDIARAAVRAGIDPGTRFRVQYGD